ncbi:hypothetical protein F5X99DRAFT_402937 [Biscogniauxia marginata]|nr:hypothetical protein F5X99DRAFT_402937 [Biscogniauxia marginata]
MHSPILALAIALTFISPATSESADFDMNTIASCVDALQFAGIKTIYSPGSDEYVNRTESYFSVSAQLKPSFIVQPSSTEEVAKVITALVHSISCNWAIRSGGHTVWPGANNIDNGVTIDLGLMNTTIYEPETSIAKIQAGSRWERVYETLGLAGKTVPGGRTATVGVAGFLTGGGNTFYTARRGLGCDNVVNFEVVLATGEVVNANANENSDLFKALKGGSSNFGIVTRFDMEAFDAPNLWGGLVTYPTSTTDHHIAAYVNWTNNIENYPDGSAIIFWSYTPTDKKIGITAAYEDITGAVAPPAFDEFMAIPDGVTSTMRLDSHLNLAKELNLVDGYRNVWFAIAFKNDARFFKKAIAMHEEFVENWKPLSPDGDFICHAIVQSIPTLFSKHSVAKGGNMLGLDRLVDNAVMFQVQFAFRGEAKEEEARRRMVEYRETLKGYTVELGGAVEWEYLNYADYTQDPLKSYGKENVAFLREVASKYDPGGIFQTRMPGGFKISKVV